MAGIYETFANAASGIYGGDLGGSFVLRRYAGGGYDDEGNEVPVIQMDKRVRGIVKPREVWNKGAYLGTRMVAQLDNRVEPKPNDQLIVGNKTYAITDVTTIAPNGVTVIRYEAGLS